MFKGDNDDEEKKVRVASEAEAEISLWPNFLALELNALKTCCGV
mgnify:CR=1 FL=1